MGIVGGRSGFTSARDLLLFGIGAFIDLYHLLVSGSGELAIEVLILGAGLMGAPYVLRRDETKETNQSEQSP